MSHWKCFDLFNVIVESITYLEHGNVHDLDKQYILLHLRRYFLMNSMEILYFIINILN